MAGNLELEAAILENPDDPRPYLVYADWLQQRGDPRGELIVLQHQAETDKRARRAVEALLEEHGAQFLGEFYDVKRKQQDWDHPEMNGPWILDVEWRFGFVRAARMGWPTFAAAGTRADEFANEELHDFLQLPSLRFVQRLRIGPLPGDVEPNPFALPGILESVKPPVLRSLVLCELGQWEHSDTWIVLPACEAVPELRHLHLRGGQMHEVPTLELPELRELTVESTRLTAEDLEQLCRARCPKLVSLTIDLGPEDADWPSELSVEDVQRYRERLPGVEKTIRQGKAA